MCSFPMWCLGNSIYGFLIVAFSSTIRQDFISENKIIHSDQYTYDLLFTQLMIEIVFVCLFVCLFVCYSIRIQVIKAYYYDNVIAHTTVRHFKPRAGDEYKHSPAEFCFESLSSDNFPALVRLLSGISSWNVIESKAY